jgi:hypothetical protein
MIYCHSTARGMPIRTTLKTPILFDKTFLNQITVTRSWYVFQTTHGTIKTAMD